MVSEAIEKSKRARVDACPIPMRVIVKAFPVLCPCLNSDWNGSNNLPLGIFRTLRWPSPQHPSLKWGTWRQHKKKSGWGGCMRISRVYEWLLQCECGEDGESAQVGDIRCSPAINDLHCWLPNKLSRDPGRKACKWRSHDRGVLQLVINTNKLPSIQITIMWLWGHWNGWSSKDQLKSPFVYCHHNFKWSLNCRSRTICIFTVN